MRYLVACAIAVATTSVRTALTPALGTHSPLLPALAAVLAAVVVSGRGPGRVAIALCSIITTMAVYPWPTTTEFAQWTGHVVLFISIGVCMTEVVHSLQLLQRRQLASMRAAQQAESHAQAAAAQLLLIADSVPVLIAYVDSHQRYRFNNRQYEEWFGVEAKDLHGKHVREVLGTAAYDTLKPGMLQALDGRAAHFEAEVPYRTGGTRHVSVHYVPDMDAESNVCGFFALIEDVSERHRSSAALRDAERRKDEFLAMLSHEMRNPLAAIVNGTLLLNQPSPDANRVRGVAALLQRQTAQLTRIVDDLLDVARISRGTVELHREIVNVESAIDAAVEGLKPQLDRKHQRVNVIRSSHPSMVDADRLRLSQVFSNLISNASKYSAPHSPITVVIDERDGHAVVQVRDEGQGIDAQLLPLVFELFTQGERTLERREGGLGIGLTIVRSLIQMHAGTVEARSAGGGQGSEFIVRLPLCRQPADSPSARVRASESKRILLVDDNVDAVETLALLLQSEGHVVRVCHDGAHALHELTHYPAQVVLLDIGLPSMDGYEVAQAIRARPETAHVLLVALTGYGRPEDRDAALRAGFDAHLAKPVGIDRLLELLCLQPTPHVPASQVLHGDHGVDA